MYAYKINYQDKIYTVHSNSLNYAIVLLISYLNVYILKSEISVLKKIKNKNLEPNKVFEV